MIAKMEHLGVSKSVVGLVIPTGYSFNLDGTNINRWEGELDAKALHDTMAHPTRVGEEMELLPA
jgi:aerobic C4-dicarboxylate transport protein